MKNYEFAGKYSIARTKQDADRTRGRSACRDGMCTQMLPAYGVVGAGVTGFGTVTLMFVVLGA